MSNYEDKINLLIDKIDGVVDYSWEDLVDELKLSVHPDSLRKAFAVTDFSGYNIAKYYQHLMESGLNSADIRKLEGKRDEIYRERVRLQDERRLHNAEERIQARYENLVEVLEKSIRNITPLQFASPKNLDKNGNEASLLISDIHYGLEVDNAFNYYDTTVARERMNLLCEKTIAHCKKNNVKKLHINLMGDLINGLIRIQHRIDAEEDTVTQISHCAELLSNVIGRLSECFEVVVRGCVGNHSRLNADKKLNMPAENFERLIFEHIELRLPNIKVLINGLEDWYNFKIGDREIFVSHGDKDSVNTVLKNAINLTGKLMDECLIGHIHHMNMTDECGTEIISNGSVIGADDYAISLRKTTKPYQVLRIYGEDIITYKLMLDI